MAKVDIYGLYCPDSGAIRYIGKANCSAERLKSHLRDSKKRKSPVQRWISDLLKDGKRPILEVLITVHQAEWEMAERDIIFQARSEGQNILNVANGGNEPRRRKDRLAYLVHRLGIELRHGHVSEATKAKLRQAYSKNPHLFPKSWATRLTEKQSGHFSV